MSEHDRTLSVIEAFYDAAMDESLWPAALKKLTDLTNSQAATFWVLDGSDTPRLPTFIFINFDSAAVQEYLQHTAAIDPTVQYLVAHPCQAIVHDGLVISEREKDKHPYYDWHDRRIETRFRMVGQARLTPSVQAGVALHRTRKVGRYEPRDIERFAVLHGHLERALAIGSRLESLGATHRLTADWLDRNAAAVVFLDDQKRILFASRHARELDSETDGIRLGADGISLLRRPDNDRLQALIVRTISSTVTLSDSAGGAMRAERPSGKRPYAILVGPVSKSYSTLSSVRPAVCIVITDPERQVKLPHRRIQILFSLTEAEARLAVFLASGEELRSAAEKLGITYGSARTRLAEIFQKTGTRRQGELIRLLLSTIVPD